MTVEDPFESRPRPEDDDAPKHKRLNGRWCADYFCMHCGAPMTVGEEGHGPGDCEDNYELVNELRRINLW